MDRVPATFQVATCDGGPGFPCLSQVVEVDGEVFTQLTWNVGAVAAGTTVSLGYTVFAGEQEITAQTGEGPETRHVLTVTARP